MTTTRATNPIATSVLNRRGPIEPVTPRHTVPATAAEVPWSLRARLERAAKTIRNDGIPVDREAYALLLEEVVGVLDEMHPRNIEVAERLHEERKGRGDGRS